MEDANIMEQAALAKPTIEAGAIVSVNISATMMISLGYSKFYHM